MQWLLQQAKRGLHAGTHDDQYPPLQARIRLANVFGLVVGLGVLPFAMLTRLAVVQYTLFATALLYASIPLLNHYGQHRVARAMACIVIVVVLAALGAIDNETNLEVFDFFKLLIFGLMFMPLTMFVREERHLTTLCTIFCGLLFFSFDFINQQVDNWVILPHFDSTPIQVALIKYYAPALLIGVMLLSFLFTQRADYRYVRELMRAQQHKNDLLKAHEHALKEAMISTQTAYAQAHSNEQTLLASKQNLEIQTQNLERARLRMRRMLRRLRTTQVKTEEQAISLQQKQYVSEGLTTLMMASRYHDGLTMQQWGTQVVAATLGYSQARAGILLVMGLQQQARLAAAGEMALASNAELEALGRETSLSRVMCNRQINTGAANAKAHAYAVPLLYNDELKGVACFVYTQQVTDDVLAYLHALGPALGTHLQTTESQLAVQQLLQEVTARNMQLQQQDDKLRTSVFELEQSRARILQQQEQLAQQEANLMALINNTQDSIILLDTSYNIVVANDAIVKRYASYGHQLSQGQSIFSYLSEKDKKIWKGYYDSARAGTRQQFSAKRIDEGKERQVEYSINPVRDANGKVTGISVFSRDITARYQAEQALRESEAKLRNLNDNLADEVERQTQEVRANYALLRTTFDATTDGILIFDPKGELVNYNTKFAEMWQVPPFGVYRPTAAMMMRKAIAQVRSPQQMLLTLRSIMEADPYESRDILMTTDGRTLMMYSYKTQDSNYVGRIWVYRDITELTKAEEVLRESEARFKLFFELTSEGIVLHDDGIIIDTNNAMEAITGYPSSAVIGQSVFSFVHTEDRAGSLQYFKERRETTYELRVFDKRKGVYKPCRVRANTIMVNGRMLRAVLIHDLTDIREAERTLRESEGRFRLFSDLTNEGILLHDNGICIDLNNRLAQIVGREVHELLGKNLFDYIHPDDRERIYKQMINEGNDPAEVNIIHASGIIIPCEIKGRTLTYQDRKVRAVVLRDLSAAKQAEQQLASIGAAMPIPILVNRWADATVLYYNQEFEDLFGLPEGGLIGKKSKYLYYDPNDLPLYRAALAANDGFIRSLEMKGRRKDGSIVWAICNSSRTVFKGEDALITGFNDITEQKLKEQQLFDSKSQLEQAYGELQSTRSQLALSEKMALLGQLIAGVAHEINTPLAATKTSAQNMQDVLPLGYQLLTQLVGKLKKADLEVLAAFIQATQQHRRQMTTREERMYRKQLEQALETAGVSNASDYARSLVEVGFADEISPYLTLLQGKHAEAVLETVFRIGQINNSLENIKIASDKTRNIVQALKRYTHTSHTEAIEPVNLLDNLNTILILYAFQIRQQTRLVTNFDATPVVMANADKLGQVWTNLITNALQAMEPGGKLMIDLLQKDGMATVQVADTGKGIPDSVLPHIFEPFFTTKTKGEGTGLGLNICKHIIESFGGSIAVSSQPGCTVFTVQLPIADATTVIKNIEAQQAQA